MFASERDIAPTLGQVLAALSRALDLTEGLAPGHAARTARIALRLARELQLSKAECESLYYAALLKDSGCSSNSARIYPVFGADDVMTKRDVKFVDWSSKGASMNFAIKHVAPGGSVGAKLRKLAGMMGPPSKVMDEVTKARCTRGAMVARSLGMSEDTAMAIQALDEHWDGKGAPAHLAGRNIPLAARILCLSQTLEVFATAYGMYAGFDVAQERSGRWFDPELVQAALSFENDTAFWRDHSRHVYGEPIVTVEPESADTQDARTIDQVCETFATIVDAKSSFTGEHSARVAEYAVALGRYFGYREWQINDLRRAGLLHDLGKLGVPNSVLDKPGRLDEEEFALVKKHPQHSYDILSQIRGFERIAEVAAAHHERLDGRGYWKGLGAESLDLDMRILAVADVFDALRAARPYRGALPLDEVFAIMERESESALDPACVRGLQETYGSMPVPLAA